MLGTHARPQSRYRLYLTATVPLIVAVFALPKLHVYLWGLLGLSAAAVVFVGVRINKPRLKLPWILVAAALATFIFGDITYDVLTKMLGYKEPFPSLADLFYLATYPLFAAALLLMARARRPRHRDVGALLDALIVTTSSALLSWLYLIQPYVRDASLPLIEKVVSISYPLGDIFILCVLARLLAGSGRRNGALNLLCLGALGLLGADVVYGWILLHGTWNVGGPTDIGWVLFYVCWGAAALHPAMSDLTQAQPKREEHLSTRTLIALSLATLVSPLLLVWRIAVNHTTNDAVMIGVASVGVFVLVMARMTGLAQMQVTSARREHGLRAFGERLVAATDLAEVYVAALDAVANVAGSSVVACAITENSGSGEWIAAARPSTIEGDELRLGVGPTDGTMLQLAGLDEGESHRSLRWTSTPLSERHGTKRSVFVAHIEALPFELRTVLDAIGSQLTLALERVELAKDLHERRTEVRFRSLIQNASDVILVVDEDGRLQSEAPSVEAVLGYSPLVIEGMSLTDLVHGEDAEHAAALVAAMRGRRASGALRTEWRVRRRDGHWLTMEIIGNDLSHEEYIGGVVLTMRDVSDRRQLEDELRHRAFHDELTNLPNRLLFADRVENALSRRDRHQRCVAVLLIDVDDFKLVNDRFGHGAGDELLILVSSRLLGCVRHADTVARLSGDEFAICAEFDAVFESGASDLAGRILDSFRTPLWVSGHEINTRLSIGISIAIDGTTSAADMLREADLALYAAKNGGKNAFRFFEGELHQAVIARLERRDMLEKAIAQDELRVYYQPIVDLEDGQIQGVEALVRWQHPEHGLLLPDEFISIAEDSGLIVQLGRWVLDRACADVASWQPAWLDSHEKPLGLSVNVSPKQLQSFGFVESVDDTLTKHGIDPRLVTLEVTESVLVRDSETVMERLRELHETGLSLALDDFGTGYSSLSYLHRFPLSVIKIDQSFVHAMSGGESMTVLRAIVSIAQSLDLDVIAEGIESDLQRRHLCAIGCTMGQGFLYAEPTAASNFGQLLQGSGQLQFSGVKRVSP